MVPERGEKRLEQTRREGERRGRERASVEKGGLGVE